MDLFNPPKDFNYRYMTHKLDVDKLINPHIQVVWEDSAENFTQERIKRIVSYFEKKYKSKNVNVITKVKSDDNEVQSIDVSTNILDINFQRDLIRKYLESGGYKDDIDDIIKIDDNVEAKISAEKSDIIPFKKWYIRRIEFSNFLSFGDNQVLDFDRMNGICVIEGNPSNFSGKSSVSVDLLLFLFFNTTTKTTKAEEVFNRFRDKDKVVVKGDITIDGEDYIIVREVKRRLTKKGEWTVSTDLDFFKKLADGSLQNFTGEQRRETEQFIKSSIGDMNDFLMTIVTTGSNLEELIESKPTARGQVLSRFLGLDSLKLKEEVAKEIYSDFSKRMISNIYNKETLKQEIETNVGLIAENNNKISEYNNMLSDVLDRISKGQKYRDELVSKKHTGLDEELLKINPANIETEILEYDSKINSVSIRIGEVKVVEPSEFYHEDKHDMIKNEIADLKVKKGTSELNIKVIEEELRGFEGGIKCKYCDLVLAQSEYSKKRGKELDEYKTNLIKYIEDLNNKELEDSIYSELKKEFDTYERNKLIREKLLIEKETLELKKSKEEERLKRFREDEKKVEENNSLDAIIIKADLRLEELRREKEGISNNIQICKNNIDNYKKKIEDNKNKIKQIEEESKKQRIYKIYLELFGKNGISKMIMKTMVPVINSELQRLLSDSAEFKLEVRISDKNEVEFWMIDNNTQIEKLMSSGSGYEKTIASLALRSVLSKVCSLPKPNVVVMDEVFGRISNDNLEMVGEFFNKIKEYFDKILIISHNPLISQWGDTNIRVEKVNNVSKVIQ